MANADFDAVGDNLPMARKVVLYRPTHIRDWREAKEMTLADFAVAMEMNEGYLSDIENGKRRYNQDILEKAAKILGVPTAYLLYRKPLPKEKTAINYADPAVAASAMDELTEADRSRIAGVIASYHKPFH